MKLKAPYAFSPITDTEIREEDPDSIEYVSLGLHREHLQALRRFAKPLGISNEDGEHDIVAEFLRLALAKFA